MCYSERRYVEYCYTECANKPFLLSVIMLSVVMLNVVMLSVDAPFKDNPYKTFFFVIIATDKKLVCLSLTSFLGLVEYLRISLEPTWVEHIYVT